MKDPKKIAMLIIGKKKPEEPEKDSPAEEQEEGDYSSKTKDQAAQDIFDAIKSDDFEEFKSALHDYVMECMEAE